MSRAAPDIDQSWSKDVCQIIYCVVESDMRSTKQRIWFLQIGFQLNCSTSLIKLLVLRGGAFKTYVARPMDLRANLFHCGKPNIGGSSRDYELRHL
jgi:hypothetical protein